MGSSAPVSTRLIPQQVKAKRSSATQPEQGDTQTKGRGAAVTVDSESAPLGPHQGFYKYVTWTLAAAQH